MNKHRKFQTAAGLGAGLLLLSAALAAWGINITLNDNNGNTVTCATSGNATIAADGTITASVIAGTGCDLSGGGGSPPPPGSFTLSVSRTGTGSGTVTSSPVVINCGTDCTETYPENTAINVTLTAVADSGSTFTGWSGAGCLGTGTCTVAQTITSNLNVTATFTADTPPPGSCGATPPDVISNSSTDTGNLNVGWPTTPAIAPLPSQIYAFKVTVPSGFTGRSNFTATRHSQALKAKALVVSTCPGVLTPVGGQSACTKQNAADAATIRLSTNSSDPSYYCKLTPGVYYVNAVSKNLLSDSVFNCTTPTNCQFFAGRGAPY